MHLFQHLFIGRRFKVMQQIRKQNGVIAGAIFHVKSAPRQQMITIAQPLPGCILLGHLQYVSPIQCIDVRFRQPLRHGNTE